MPVVIKVFHCENCKWFSSVVSWKDSVIVLSLGNTDDAVAYHGPFLFFCYVIRLQTDANIASTSNNAQTKAKDLKKPSHRSIYDQTSVKLVMAGTGCSNVAVVEHV